ncbi:MAG TPA: ROK family transcriptional regulator [Bryobacteraceae bacterium]|jgi:predicted NBD/HSP70 family sugar kinase|nr:ROK family transcriptional regulator [Bryobacteraceae bacterium]
MSSKIASTGPLNIHTATPSSVRAVNRSIILGLIRRRQPISRAELARLTGIFRSSVSDIIDELLEEALVKEERSAPSRRGRVPMSLTLNDSGHRVLGLNIRPVYCQIASAGLSGIIGRSHTFPTPASPKELVQAVAKSIRQLRKERPAGESEDFQRIGIAIPGHVDVRSGKILWTPTHSELSEFPITDQIREQTGIEALADNDCNAGALSELWLSSGEKKDRSTDFIFLNVSDFGAGAGAVLNGEVYLGHDAKFAAEIGHMIVDPSGPVCRCQRHGCWELYISNYATWRRAYPRSPFTLEGFSELLAQARAGNARALAACKETARYLSLGISNIGFAFNPAQVIVAGRITAIWDIIRTQVETEHGCSHLTYSIRPARLSADDSLLHGAVCLALHHVFVRPSFGEVSARKSA